MILIVYKAVTIPITHDEVLTTTFYSNFSVWEIMQYPNNSPNNHILNTLLTKCALLFGNDPWIVRLPNILFFTIYSFAVYRIVNIIFDQSKLFFVLAASLFIANPYLLDFFSLSRGYGISVSLCLLSFSYLLSGFKTSNSRHIWLSFGFSLLASYANFTLLVVWAANGLLVTFYFIAHLKQDKKGGLKAVMTLFCISLAFLSLIFVPLKKMQSTDQFIHWTSNGFIEDTVKPLVWHSTYFSDDYNVIRAISYGVIALVLISLILLVLRLRRSTKFIELISSPLSIATLLLSLTIVVNLLQTWILNVPNLNGRTALFFYPMTVALLLVVLRDLGRSARLSLLVPISFLGFYNLLQTPTEYVREWEYDRYTYEVHELLLEHRNGDEPVSLSVHWMFHPSFQFYVHTGDTPWLDLPEFSYIVNPASESEFYYVRAMDEEILSENFKAIHRFANGNILMKKRDLPSGSK